MYSIRHNYATSFLLRAKEKQVKIALTENEKRKIQFLIGYHLKGKPSLRDIRIMDIERGYFPDTDNMKVKRFDTERKGWTNGYFHVSLIGKKNVVYVLFGDSEEPKSERKFYLPKEGESPSHEWSFLSRNIAPTEDGTAFLNRFSDCFSSCGVECYLCKTSCLFKAPIHTQTRRDNRKC